MKREGSDGMGREICRGEGVVQSDGGEERGGGESDGREREEWWRVMEEGRGRSDRQQCCH